MGGGTFGIVVDGHTNGLGSGCEVIPIFTCQTSKRVLVLGAVVDSLEGIGETLQFIGEVKSRLALRTRGGPCQDEAVGDCDWETH